MKKLHLTIIFVLLFLLSQAQTKNFIDLPYIEVNGNADTLLTPNEIYIRIIISEKDSRDKISVEDQEIKMITFLKSSGIEPEKDLTINDMTSNFCFYLLQNRDVLKTKQYMLKVNDAVTVSKVFIGLEDIGISNASIERVDHSDLENIKNLMRSKAIENAKGKALAMTKPLNQNIAAAIYIADNENYNASNTLQGRAEGVIVTGYGGNQKSKQGIPKIDFEKIRAAANINVKFLLKDSLL